VKKWGTVLLLDMIVIIAAVIKVILSQNVPKLCIFVNKIKVITRTGSN